MDEHFKDIIHFLTIGTMLEEILSPTKEGIDGVRDGHFYHRGEPLQDGQR